MSYYQRDEQETLYNYDVLVGKWRVSSTYPPHIRKLIAYAQITSKTEDSEGRTIEVNGFVDPNQIRLFKPRL